MSRTVLHRLYRRFRFGEPIVVVSGLPRSGTSMAMRMLAHGGVPLLTDGIRPSDEDNPRGYFECEAVKQLEHGSDHRWLACARGKAIKIVSYFLGHLPPAYNYRVIFMRRDLEEVLASQRRMLERRGEPTDAGGEASLRQAYERHLRDVRRMLAARACFDLLDVDFGRVLRDPHLEAVRVNAFLGGHFDTAAMAAAVDAGLYRQRAG